MPSRQSFLTISFLVAIALAGCSSSTKATEPDPSPTHFNDEKALRNAVESAGLNCDRDQVVKSEGATSITCSGTMSIALYHDSNLFEKKRTGFVDDGRRVLAGDSWLVVETGGNDLNGLQEKIGGTLLIPDKWTQENSNSPAGEDN